MIERSRGPCSACPADYRLGIVPGSDTGAFEMALWSLLGARGVDVLAWESFGEGWVTDVAKQLQARGRARARGALWRAARSRRGRLRPRRGVLLERHDLGRAGAERRLDPDRPRGARRSATPPRPRSPWSCHGAKLDVVTWSWQKVLGGEAQHGMLVLSPRAVARLESYKPAWPLPKIFRLTKGGKLIEGIFKGETINTPSHARGRGCAGRAALGRVDRRTAGAGRALRAQSRRDDELGRAQCMGRFPGRVAAAAGRRPRSASRSPTQRSPPCRAMASRRSSRTWPSS